MNAMNNPMPPAMAPFKLGLIEFITISRAPPSESARNSTPETNTTPSAVAHGTARPAAAAAGMTEKTKKKFSPMPGACATGYRA
jgi:hypothetical protein